MKLRAKVELLWDESDSESRSDDKLPPVARHSQRAARPVGMRTEQRRLSKDDDEEDIEGIMWTF
jgi:hypothetical protein